MVKAFILVLMFESGGADTVAMHHIEFSSRQTCEAARVTMAAVAKQARPVETIKPAASAAASSGDSKSPREIARLLTTTCLEK